MAGRFAGLSKVRTNQGGLYYEPGNYRIKIDLIKFQMNRKRKEQIIVETTCRKSDNATRPAGCQPSYVITLDPEYFDTAMGDVKRLLATLLGISDPDSYVPDDGQDVDAFWDGAVEDMISDAQPFKDTELDLTVVHRTTKSGGTFSVHTWKAVA